MELDNIKYHSTLARYFENKERYLDEEKRKPNTRKLVEQPWQQTKAELWDDVTKTLCDLLFIEAKIVNSMTYELIDDYNTVLKVLPEAQEEVRKEKEHQARVKKYTDDMIAYASKWNEARKKNREDPEKFPMPKDEDIPLPEIIQSVEPWSDERRKKETERIINNPTRLDKVRAYSQFVISESSAFAKYGTHPGFVIQHTYNNADYPPIFKAVEKETIKDNRNILLLQKFRKPVYDPFPTLLNTIQEHTGSIWSVAITADGKRAVSGSDDKTLRLWDLESGTCLKVLEGFISWGNSVAITPDGKRAISGSGGTLRLWDLEKGECLKVLENHSTSTICVAITPDGNRAVSGSHYNALRLWDLESGECLKVLKGHISGFYSIAITPDGKTAVSGSEDKTLRLWDLESGKRLKVLEGHTDVVYSVAITSDGKRAVSGSYDKTIRLWNLEKGSCLKVLEGHKLGVLPVAITPDGKRAVSGSYDTTLRLWDLESGECLKVLEGHTFFVNSVSITPDGKTAVSGSDDKTLVLWNLESDKCPKIPEGHTDYVKSVAITSDGKRAISGSHDQALWLWDFESGECLKVLEGRIAEVDSFGISPHISFGDGAENELVFSAARVESVAITPDGKSAVSGCQDKTLRLWDLESGECVKVLEGHRFGVLTVAITPDGKRAVSGSYDKTLRLWDLEGGECLKVLEGHTDNVISVAITPDGKRAISGSRDTLRLWDLENGECLKVLKGHTYLVNSVVIMPNGKRAVSGSWDNTLRLWDLESCECLKVIKGHSEFVNSVGVTSDGKSVISGSDDKTLRLWDLESGECVSILSTSSYTTSLAYSYHLNSIISGYSNGRVLFHQLLNFNPNIPIIISQRLWTFGNSNSKGKWNKNITAVCQYCGTRFKVPEKYISLIKAINKDAGITPDMSPCLSLPDEAFENPGLLSECPNCKKPIKFNPFIVDNWDNEFYNK